MYVVGLTLGSNGPIEERFAACVLSSFMSWCVPCGQMWAQRPTPAATSLQFGIVRCKPLPGGGGKGGHNLHLDLSPSRHSVAGCLSPFSVAGEVLSKKLMHRVMIIKYRVGRWCRPLRCHHHNQDLMMDPAIASFSSSSSSSSSKPK